MWQMSLHDFLMGISENWVSLEFSKICYNVERSCFFPGQCVTFEGRLHL